ncbi:hypothetical protein BCU70_05930 [Vibrio sp. 10N.286.49.C2]|uniref:hypothetical protein n=1 Tax=unclassified Vibrio TaxID=2614977 RepID=UPI000C84E242|nr:MULTISPECIES: hypothetical protein [unclassified Vibrio]PMH31440.1 hypothetical protein BCU70_05930 [Vibrio sp. 10N.286.49.C2]PMH50461.1 hypothetical protein BCU66_18290 [Vibrio sp. 10N.286.49.B1]PMH78057.1 hypothetical protein BCU58_11025 [Vibrio sp. 10N.286.48.B7]
MSTRKAIVVLTCVLGIASCASTPTAVDRDPNLSAEQIQTAQKQEYNEILATHSLWTKRLEDAESLRIYAPENYRDMMSSWKDAHELFIEMRKNPAQVDVKHSVFSSETYAIAFRDRMNTVEYNFTAIQRLKKQADELLAPAMTQMAYLRKLDAAKYFRHANTTVTREYEQLFQYLVVSEVDRAENYQAIFLEKATALEVRVIDAMYVDPLASKLSNLSSARYNILAPISFSYVDQGIIELRKFVSQSPRDFETIERDVDSINFQFRRLEVVVTEVTKLNDVEKSNFEPLVLAAESRLHKISTVAKGNDYRDQDLTTQSERIAHDVEMLNKAEQSSALRKENAQLRQEIALLELQNSSDQGNTEQVVTEVMDKAAYNRLEIENLKKLVSALQEKTTD